MIEIRPSFKDIESFEEFDKYYWYREELSQICKSLGLEYRCTKKELNNIIEQYFKGNRIEKSIRKVNKKHVEVISLNTPYDNSTCQWNQFLKDFCADEHSNNYSNKLKVAAILWKEVRESKNEKVYSKQLLNEYGYKLEEYRK